MGDLFDKTGTWMQQGFGLDKRLLKGLSRLGYTYPTRIQASTLPIALQGKDVLVRARTGSGKTVAFALPVLQRVLSSKTSSTDQSTQVSAIVLAPTKELARQITNCMNDLIYYCRDFVTITCASDEKGNKVLNADIIVSTPAKLAQLTQKSANNFSAVSILVIDEADLVLSYGYKADVHTILGALPKIVQGILMSATLSAELEKFKKVVLHNPAIIRLEEAKSEGNLLQFFLPVTESDKFLVLYVFLKLGLLQGKGLIFVNDINKCYRLKLFLQQFYISAAVLNAEVPTNSRQHILEEFNRGLFDYLIATDAAIDNGDEDDDNDNEEESDGNEDENEDEENEVDANVGEEDGDVEQGAEDGEAAENEDNEDMEIDEDEIGDDEGDEEHDFDDEGDMDSEDEEDVEDPDAAQNRAVKALRQLEKAQASSVKQARKNKTVVEKDEYGVSRGIDFAGVQFVLNFDMPVTVAAYTHRIGRTARGINRGTALSFVSQAESGKSTAKEFTIADRDVQVLSEVQERQPRLGYVEGDNVLQAMGALDRAGEHDESRVQPAPLVFNMAELESFRYRVEDTLRSVTSVAVRELRSAEIRHEILNSDKLKGYFAENPGDLKILRHDKAILHPIQPKEHLKHIPLYLIPDSMRSVAQLHERKSRKEIRNIRRKHAKSVEQRKQQSRSRDPLYGGGGAKDSNDQASILSDVSYPSQIKNVSSSNKKSQAPATPAAANPHHAIGAQYGQSTSGRKQWKERHGKGEFNPIMKKRQADIIPGTFQKAKKRKF